MSRSTALLKRWLARKATIATLALIVGVVFSPSIMAFAANKSVDPIPRVHITTWDGGNAQAFVNAATDSTNEVLGILASYGRVDLYYALRPTVASARCHSTESTELDENAQLTALCPNRDVLYLGERAMNNLVEQKGEGALLAHIVQLAAAQKATTTDLVAFSACAAGAWLGYVSYMASRPPFVTIVTESQRASFVAYFVGRPTDLPHMQRGFAARSLDPCFT